MSDSLTASWCSLCSSAAMSATVCRILSSWAWALATFRRVWASTSFSRCVNSLIWLKQSNT